MRGWPFILTLSTACTPAEPALLYLTPGPYAIGATANGRIDGLDRIVIDPPDVFAVSIDGDDFELHALAEGTATMTVFADRANTRFPSALPIERVSVAPLIHGEPCSTPALYMVGLTARLPVELRNGDEALHGRVQPPITALGGMIITDFSDDGTLDVRLPSTAGTVTLASPIDTSFSYALAAYEPSQIEAFVIGDPAPPTVLRIITITADPIVAGRVSCGDGFNRNVTAEPADVCAVETLAPEITLRALRSGTCTVTVNLGGLVTTSKTFSISL